MSLLPEDDPQAAVDELASCNTPWLFGVRHHSPACATALPPLLDAYKPTVIALEMPADLQQWIEWLGHPEAEAPLAVGAVSKSGSDLGFYPFADFSPELVVIRWARANKVPVIAIDLPSARRGGRDRGGDVLGIEARLRGADDDSWDTMVEGPAVMSDPERVRRAALLYGWALRLDSVRGSGVSDLDLAREAFMREMLEKLAAGEYEGASYVEKLPAKNMAAAKKPAKKAAAAKKPAAKKKPAAAAVKKAATPVKKAAAKKATPAAKKGKKAAEEDPPAEIEEELDETEAEDDDEDAEEEETDLAAVAAAEVDEIIAKAAKPEPKAEAKPAAAPPPKKEVKAPEPKAEAKPAAPPKKEAKAEPKAAAPVAPPTPKKPPVKPVAKSGGKKSGERVACIVGSFHAAALLPEPTLWKEPSEVDDETTELVSSLIPYGFELLDSRSGYPAGIRDPMWQQRLWQTQKDKGDVTGLVAQCLVEITRGVRQKGLPASVADARAATELAMSLASLRGLAAPGRRELVEGVQTALTHGELMGRGRVVAQVMQGIMVGHARGRLALDTPRSGLAPHVFALLDELRLPHKGMLEPVDLRLDPLRSPIDRRRHVCLARMRACGIPYGTEEENVGIGGVESLTSAWKVHFTPSSEAVIELAGLRGITLKQASAGTLRSEYARLVKEDKLTAINVLALAESACEAGAGDLAREWLTELTGPRLVESTLTELIQLIALLDRILAGHVVGLPTDPDDVVEGELDLFVAPDIDRGLVLNTAVASIMGLAGSESLEDCRSLAELIHVLDRPEHETLGDSRLRWSIEQLITTGTPVICGAASIVQVQIDAATAEQLSNTMGGWVDLAVDIDTRRLLSGRMKGAISIAGPLFEAAPVFLDGVCERIEKFSDEDFLLRVSALRDGFETLSTESRRRLLRSLGDRLGENDARGQGLDVAVAIPLQLMEAAAEADRAGRVAAEKIPRPDLLVAPTGSAAQLRTFVDRDFGIPVRDRWRMILGHERDQMKPKSMRAARALDELYGKGHGEGSRTESGPGGGQESSYPTVREWREEIEALFGNKVFEEVAAKAAQQGRVGALLELDPEQVTPSVELLEQVLSLKGGLGEAHLGRLRQLIKRIVDQLVQELAVRIRPALVGAVGQRPTRRPTGALHLPRTVLANLGRTKIVQAADGRDEVQMIPEKLIFKARQRRHMDWQVVLVVDVSGSMEPSVIYSAMMASIIAAVPWIGVKFITFSTEIIDLSEYVEDPLALLLEVEVGGGTHIAKGMRYARSLITVPQRTIVIVVSDFEEGYSVESLIGEIRTLVEAGVHCLGLAALDDRGAPRYAVPIAEQIAAAGMPVAALTPLELARWVGDKIR